MDDPEGDGLVITLAQAGVQAPIQGGPRTWWPLRGFEQSGRLGQAGQRGRGGICGLGCTHWA